MLESDGEIRMASEFISALEGMGVDVNSALSRMLHKEEMYKKFLRKFREDKNTAELKDLIGNADALTPEDVQKIFQSSHTIKGVAGNLGLTAIYNESSYICEATRNHTPDIADMKLHMNILWSDYELLMDVLDTVL
jgi:HPt (histidine-containing phosphotransfer) domain-containing protein